MYEFNDAENASISRTATWATALAILLIIGGVLLICTLSPVRVIGYITMGVFMIVGATSLRKVVATRGNDIQHMMSAVDALGRALLVRTITLVLVLLWTIGVTVLQLVGVLAVM